MLSGLLSSRPIKSPFTTAFPSLYLTTIYPLNNQSDCRLSCLPNQLQTADAILPAHTMPDSISEASSTTLGRSHLELLWENSHNDFLQHGHQLGEFGAILSTWQPTAAHDCVPAAQQGREGGREGVLRGGTFLANT